jgi:hypothetical protein
MRITLTSTMSIVVGLFIAPLMAATSSAAEWGSIKGRFVVDGTPPQLPPLNLATTKDQFCMDTKPENETLVVGEGGTLANAVVFVRLPRRGKIEVHPDYDAQLSEPAVLDNKGCSFHPHLTFVRIGQPFIVKNSDPVGHNTKGSLSANGAFNPTVPAGGEIKMTFSKAESIPMPVNCSIHPFMSAHMLVQDHPYMTASKEDGTFEIKNIPAGKHEFQFWHEAMGYLKNVKLKGSTANRQGRAQLTIAAGQTLDLGDIKVPASGLK